MSEEIFILARGRGKVLFQNGFEYYHHVTYRTNQISLWRCMNYKTKKCYGTITINQSKDQVIKFKEHSVFCLPNVNKSEINKIITKTFEKTRIIIFCTEDGRNIIKTGKAFLSDGTFKKCPKPFVQLYVIFCDVGSSEDNNKVVPVLYALLTDKKKTTYSYIKKQIPEWTPSNFVTDFEQATISAIKEIFPEIHHQGCYYHFREKLRRKAKKCGLTDSNSKKIVGLCSTLPLLPASKIHEGWKYIQNEIILDNPKLKIFMNYFKTFWMPKSNTWSCFGNRHRTTNTCEGWNAHYNGSFKKRPTTLFAFLKAIKNDSDFRTIVPKIQEKRKSSVLRRNSYIHHVQMQLTVGDIDVPLFLEKLRQ